MPSIWSSKAHQNAKLVNRPLMKNIDQNDCSADLPSWVRRLRIDAPTLSTYMSTYSCERPMLVITFWFWIIRTPCCFSLCRALSVPEFFFSFPRMTATSSDSIMTTSGAAVRMTRAHSQQ